MSARPVNRGAMASRLSYLHLSDAARSQRGRRNTCVTAAGVLVVSSGQRESLHSAYIGSLDGREPVVRQASQRIQSAGRPSITTRAGSEGAEMLHEREGMPREIRSKTVVQVSPRR